MGKEIVFLPDWSRGNPYQSLFVKALGGLGVPVVLRDFPKGLFPLNRVINANRHTAVLHLHWVNSLVDPVVWSHNRMKRAVKMIHLALDLALARLRGRKIVWTIHNLVAHESREPQVEIQVRRMIARGCSHVLVHSRSALNLVESTYGLSLGGKSTVVPHGNYDGCYSDTPGMEASLRARYGLEMDDTVVLFFGAIRPYKGVERLIDALAVVKGKRLRLLIAGSVADQALAEMITEVARSDGRVIAAIGFVPEDEVSALFALADVVALPFERTLTSGSATLAFTMGKALLVPEEARVFDFVNDRNALFFGSQEQLAARLASLDKGDLCEMGRQGREAVGGFTWGSVAAQVAVVYEG